MTEILLDRETTCTFFGGIPHDANSQGGGWREAAILLETASHRLFSSLDYLQRGTGALLNAPLQPQSSFQNCRLLSCDWKNNVTFLHSPVKIEVI